MIALQALLGFDRNLTHLDGHIVRLKREGVTQPGALPASCKTNGNANAQIQATCR